MNAEDIKREILDNTKRINFLSSRIRETFAHRGEGKEALDKWSAACKEFHESYDALTFPGGYGGAFKRISDGDFYTTEVALCFLELRPYFFRSGYMWNAILRKIKRAAVTKDQADRLDLVIQKHNEWRAFKRTAEATVHALKPTSRIIL